MEILAALLVGLAAGAVGGFLAGLAGVGGGLVYTPSFHAFLPALPIGVASATSLAAIVITASSSVWSHARLGNVNRELFIRLMPGLAVGAFFGLHAALKLPSFVVLWSMAVLDGWIAFDLFRNADDGVKVGEKALIVLMPFVGFVSGMLGIAGGTMLVPLLRRHVPLRVAVGTSAAAGWAMALSSLSFHIFFSHRIWWQASHQALPLLLALLLGVALTARGAARIGARMHHLHAEDAIRRFLALFFLFLSSSLFVSGAMAMLRA